MAWVGSLVLFLALSASFVLADLDTFAPWLLSKAAARMGDGFSFDRMEFGVRESHPAFEIHGVTINRPVNGRPFEFSADSAQIRLAQPAFTERGLQLDHIGITAPAVSAVISTEDRPDRATSQHSPAMPLNTMSSALSLLSNVRSIEIAGGSFDFLVHSDNLDVKALGEFGLSGNYADGVQSFVGSLDTVLHNSSKVEYRIDVFSSDDGLTASTIELDVKSLDSAWLGAVLESLGRTPRRIDIGEMTSVVDVNVKGRWVANTLESLNWDLSVRDPELDGRISDATELVITSSGEWRTDDTGAQQLDAAFELADLDARTLLDQYPAAFPPKFYRHMTERLRSLWVSRVSGTFTGDPMKVIQDRELDGLVVDGEFHNMTFLYGRNWPELMDGRGTFQVQGKRLDVTGTHGVVYGEKVGKVAAVIEDFTQPDPIMRMAAEMDVPMEAAFELFGPNGTVLPGKTTGIVSGTGSGRIALTVDVPLRRGKEFSIDGIATPGDVAVVTAYGPQVTQIEGQVNFDRIGITSGQLSARALGGQFSTEITGSGSRGSYVIDGTASGTAEAGELGPIIGSEIASRMSGPLDWRAEFRFEPTVNLISFSSPLTNVDSYLPLPLRKPAGWMMPLEADIKTVKGERLERTIDFTLDTVARGTLQSTFRNRAWHVHTGALAFGFAELPTEVESGVYVNMELPDVDFDEWSYILNVNEGESRLRFDSVQSVDARVSRVIIARDRQLNDVSVAVNRSEGRWTIDIISDEVVGRAEYEVAEYLEQGEVPSLTVNLSKCHIPEAQSDPTERSVNPAKVPNLEFSCNDLRYGQYRLGKSRITARATDDSWNIEKAQFETAVLKIEASGDWFHTGKSNIKFRFRSNDLGAAMVQLEYPDMFDGGEINLTGYLSWDDALTKWRPELTNGEIGFAARSGVLSSVATGASNAVVGLLNYDTLLQRVSVDVSDVLKGGIAYHRLGGKMRVESGIINVEGIQLRGPSVEMAVQGQTDWVRKEHNLVAGVDSNIDKSLTTITTLINPIQGLFTYLAKELLENLDINVFSLQYEIQGTWDEPEVNPVRREILVPNSSGEGRR